MGHDRLLENPAWIHPSDSRLDSGDPGECAARVGNLAGIYVQATFQGNRYTRMIESTANQDTRYTKHADSGRNGCM